MRKIEGEATDSCRDGNQANNAVEFFRIDIIATNPADVNTAAPEIWCRLARPPSCSTASARYGRRQGHDDFGKL